MGACYSSSAKDQENTPKSKKPHSRKEPKNGLALKANGTHDEDSHGVLLESKDLPEEDKNRDAQRNVEQPQDAKRDESNSVLQQKKSESEVVYDKEVVDGPEIVNNTNRDSDKGALIKDANSIDELRTTSDINSENLMKTVESNCAPDVDSTLSSSLPSHIENSSHACEKNEVNEEKISLHDQELVSTFNVPHCACCRLSNYDTILTKSESTPVTPLHKKASYLRQHSLNLENVNTDNQGSKRSSLELRGFDSTTSLELGSALESLQDVKTMEMDGKEVVVIEKDVYVQVMDELASLRHKLGLLTDIINEADILASGTTRDRSSIAQD